MFSCMYFFRYYCYNIIYNIIILINIILFVSFDFMISFKTENIFYNSIFQKIGGSLLYYILYVQFVELLLSIFSFCFEIRYIELVTLNFILLLTFVTIRISSSVLYLFGNIYLIFIFFYFLYYCFINTCLFNYLWNIIDNSLMNLFFFLFVYLISLFDQYINLYYEFL